MKNIDKNSPKYLFITMAAMSVTALIIWPLLDLILAKITNNNFSYTVRDHIVAPIIFGCVASLIFWLFDRKAKK